MFRTIATVSCLLVLAVGSVAAQQAGNAPRPQDFPVAVPLDRSSILTIKQQDLFEGSEFGKASLARLEAETQAITDENRKIESGLTAEEKRLTELRPTLKPEEFRPLADAFDKKVEDIRKARDAKSRDLTRQRAQDQQAFFKMALPVLAQLMQEFGATVLLDQSTVMVSLDRIDITQEAIARVDAMTAAASTKTAPTKTAPGESP